MILSVLDAPLTRPLLDPAAWPFPVDVRTAPSVDATSRAMLRGEFDVAEMSFATYLRARVVDGAPLRALPAFTGRRFLADHAGVRPTSAVRGPADLPGSRVAVPQYWMTSSVWHRILLRERHGVDPATVTWVTTAPERFELAGPARVERVDDGRDAARVVLEGDADVLLSPRPVPGGLRPLYGPGEAAAQYRATAAFPLMHLVVVRADLPADVVDAVWDALVAARQAAWPGPAVPGLSSADTASLFRGDPFAYGVDANAASLDALLAGAHRDGLLPAVPAARDLFVELDREALRR